MVNLASHQFLKVETKYDILMELRKDTRNVTGTITVEIIAAVPPIMEIECADPLLCLVGEGGKLFINPSSRLGVRALCSTKGGSDCSSMSYQWSIMHPGERVCKFMKISFNSGNSTPIVAIHDTNYALGCGTDPFSCGQDLAISSNVFQDAELESAVYTVQLQAMNGQQAIG